MHKIICITILKLLLLQSGFAQSQFLTKMGLTVNSGEALLTKPVATSVLNAFNYRNNSPEPLTNTLSVFNDIPLILVKRKSGKPVMIFTQLSCSDLLENAINNLKHDLVKTYDDNITELFKDAPSLITIKYIMPF